LRPPAAGPPPGTAAGDPATAADALGLYIHWPFCRSKCPYCDFNSHVRAGIDEGRWLAAFRRALATLAAEAPGRQVSSVFFGGGTPSLMAGATVAAILDAVAGHWPVADDVEVTLEANPTTAEAGHFRDFRRAGVGRLSIGVQALDDASLGVLGRGHSAAEARAAVALAARIFPRVSFDLIYARPGQTLAAWEAELAAAVAMAGDHLSVYQLTIEAGTAFARAGRAAADEDTAADLWELTQDRLDAAGLPAYEISNHARPGGACRHNLAIWRGGDYLGIGPGAHGRLTAADGVTFAMSDERSPEAWLAAVENGGTGRAERLALSAAARGEELLLTGLRLTEGVARQRFRRLTGRDVKDAVDHDALRTLIDAGFLTLDAARLRATVAGRRCLDAVLARLLA
jgi:putative oxygen-independent coproporphyrinogen III oxidase